MAVKRRGLGKGLDTLIPDKSKKVQKDLSKNRPASAKPAPVPGKSVVDLSIAVVEPDKTQPRKRFDNESINELADSIRQHGIITPILVQKRDGYYEIIAGERRWRAAKKAGLKQIPAIVKDLQDKERLEVSLIENIQREDLDEIETARAYKRLIDEHDMTQAEVAERVSKSRPAVANALRLLNLDSRVQAMLADGRLTMGHARCLLGLEDPEKQVEFAEKIIEGKLSVRAAEKLVADFLEGRHARSKGGKPAQDPYLNDLAARLTEAVGTKVKIKSRKKGTGKIEIEYYSEEDLDRIYELIRNRGLSSQ